MPRKFTPPKPSKSWKIEILQNEIDSLSLTLDTPEFYDPEEKELLIDMRDGTQQWADELEGVSKTKLTHDDIDWRIHILNNVIKRYSLILEEDEMLADGDRSVIKDDIRRLKQWKTELRSQKKTL